MFRAMIFGGQVTGLARSTGQERALRKAEANRSLAGETDQTADWLAVSVFVFLGVGAPFFEGFI